MRNVDKIYFCSPKGECGWMSNFSYHPVIYLGETYETSEHLYQSFKFDDPGWKKRVRIAPGPFEAAAAGRNPNGPLVPNWDALRIPVMRTVLELKLIQHSKFIQPLLDTGDSELIEYSKKDSFWGCGENLLGENQLGKMWMALRALLKG